MQLAGGVFLRVACNFINNCFDTCVTYKLSAAFEEIVVLLPVPIKRNGTSISTTPPIAERPIMVDRNCMLRKVAAAIHVGMSSLPWLWIGCLYGCAVRAAMVLGHWPIVWKNDPKLIADQDWLYQTLYHSVDRLFLPVVASIPLWIGLMVVARRHYSPVLKSWLVSLFIGGWVVVMLIFLVDPGAVLAWYFD